MDRVSTPLCPVSSVSEKKRVGRASLALSELQCPFPLELPYALVGPTPITATCYAGAWASCSSLSPNALSSHSRARRAALPQVGGLVEMGGKGASASMVAMRR